MPIIQVSNQLIYLLEKVLPNPGFQTVSLAIPVGPKTFSIRCTLACCSMRYCAERRQSLAHDEHGTAVYKQYGYSVKMI
jgi:hypothetical protein